MSAVLSLKPSYYEALKRLTLELAGINLGENHAFFIENRLSTLARKEGYKNLQHLVNDLFSEGQARLAIQVVSSLLERDTHFYPDYRGFKVLEEQLLPIMYGRFKGHKIRALSFGCSSGQETYSLAMMSERLKSKYRDMPIEIVGVDYPSPALDRAKRGLYTHFEVQRGLPIRELIKHFERHGEDWALNKNMRAQVQFKEFHLLSNLEELGHYHIVLFRNSLEHYSSPAQIRVIRSLSQIIEPFGILLLGSKEKLPQSGYGFEQLPNLPFVLRKEPAKAVTTSAQSQNNPNPDNPPKPDPVLIPTPMEYKSIEHR